MVGDGGNFTSSEVPSFPTIHMTADQHAFVDKGRRKERKR